MNVRDRTPVLQSLHALLPDGLKEVSRKLGQALEREDFTTALAEANRQYAAKGPRDLGAALTYAVILIHRELADEALGVLRKALEYHSDAVGLQLAQVDALFVRGDFESATALMDALKTVHIHQPRHWAYLGDMYADIDQPANAIECHEAAQARDSDDPHVALQLALLYAEQGREHDAAEMFERAGRLAPSDVDVWAGVGEAWLELGEFERAARAYERVARLADEDPTAWTLLGVARMEAGQLAKARDAFRRAQRLDPDDPEVWLNLGNVHLELGLPEEARRSFERAHELSPSDVDPVIGMTAAAFDLGDLELAERHARQSLAMDPQNPDARFNLANILLALHREEDAYALLCVLYAEHPEDIRLLVPLAIATAAAGDLEEALELMDEALLMEPDDFESLIEFGQSLFGYGGAEAVLVFLDTIEVDEPTWNAVAPVIEYLARGLRDEEEFGDALVAQFVHEIREQPQIVPVLWDFEELERLSRALPKPHRERVLAMLAVLDGRKDLDSLGDLAA